MWWQIIKSGKISVNNFVILKYDVWVIGNPVLKGSFKCFKIQRYDFSDGFKSWYCHSI